jgi:hypothetical protein
MPRLQPKTIKARALEYRKEGYSYNMISQRLGLAKSTLSDWLSDVPYIPNQEALERIQTGPSKSAQRSHAKRMEETKRAKDLARKELGALIKRDLWMIGIGLYLGEGTKSYDHVRIVNSDPGIIRLGIKWLTQICGVPTTHISLRIHAYPDTDTKETLQYWMKITRLPQGQFKKISIDKRTGKMAIKNRKLPHGTLHINVLARQKKEFGVFLHRRIMGWIEASLKQIT